ncbi:MAG: phosphoribosylformylglycinamidine cyclo-ligase, partial [Chloroflexi bacterium]|nr:phosphoribosylformylglycinamidine cyclo-ligase [Chloroflexota bacterium]
AHITGGGLPGNVPRALPDGLGARVDPARWTMPSVMRLIGALGGLDDEEVRATFNGGIGMIAIVRPEAVPATIAAFGGHDIEASLIGEVVEMDRAGGARYVEAPLEALA